jgi:tetratricopeptide (TPR) repeat protein
MTLSLSSTEIAKHNSLYNEACRLQKGLVLLDKSPVPRLGFLARRKLQKAIRLFQEALKINPEGFQSMLFIEKAYQRLGNLPEALVWFRRAHEIVPTNPIIAKEAGGQAGQLGQHDLAIEIMSPAASAHPNDVVLQYNLGYTYLMSGQTQASCDAFEHVCKLEPDFPRNIKLLALARKVHAGQIPVPKTEAEVLKVI